MQNYASTVLPIIRGTREMLLPHYGRVAEVSRKGKGAVNAVTHLDLQIETYLRESLARAYPHISFAGEEYGGSRDEDLFWLCDPIDGTGHFIHGLPFCTVMLALIERQKVVFSVVYDFVNDIAYRASRGEGAFANDERLHVSNRALSDAYLIFESNIIRSENKELHDKLFHKTGLLMMMIAGWSFAMIAAGKIDGRVTFDGWGFDYDFAPGSLLVEEAGGVVTNIGSGTYNYRNRNFLAVHPQIHKELTEGPEALFPIQQ